MYKVVASINGMQYWRNYETLEEAQRESARYIAAALTFPIVQHAEVVSITKVDAEATAQVSA